ncbi:hypothetical protein AXF42_Ash009707 [Apostasia shenzhenica]|uniref:Uncharacterized protein n=1 Tax=Apostasia shenzhenica TaxID=1088818 RepID=A0A2I0AWV1_9ASPA|nr:hypothetical protein AXF42_Ash009707 [Apostasia shenzhenica]
MDHETMELYSRSRQQDEEIMVLRKQITDAGLRELQLLNEKRILERKLSELRMAMDEKQDDAISDSLKDLNQRRGCIEENLRLSNDLKDAEEEVYVFTSSLLRLLAEYNIRLPVINASSISNSAVRLYQHMKWRIHSNDTNIIELQQGNHFPLDFNVGTTTDKFKHIPHIDMMGTKGLHGSANPDIGFKVFMDQTKELQSDMHKEVGGAATQFRADAKFYNHTPHDNQTSPASEGEVSLPGIEGFQIIGEAKPGCTLRACGYPSNGTSLCVFQWVRHLDNGTRQSIEGATVPDYVVTADDVDTFLAVDCIPMDDSGRQGELVSLFANNQNKITCDTDMQREIETHISAGRAVFNVMLLQIDSSEAWEQTTMFLKRTGYQIKVNRTDNIVIEEKYSPELYIKVPNGQSTQFVLIGSDGSTLPFSTSGTSQPYSMENDIRLRDIIVLTMRYFKSKAVDVKRKGRA